MVFSAIYIAYNRFSMKIIIVIPIIIGLLAGWLINYLADVLPYTRSFSQPKCPQCNKKFPVFNYLLLKNCSSCKNSRSPRAWIVLILSIVSSLILWFYPHPKLNYLAGFILLVYFSVVFVIDFEHRLIMHPVSVVGALLGFGVGSYLNGLIPTLLGGLGGFAIMMAFYLFGTLFARIRARKMQTAGQEPDDEEALGAGDVILATVLGLMLGWPLIWFGLLLGIMLGGLITIPMFLIMLIVRKYKQDAWMVFIPYGPFFLISAVLIIYLPNLLSVLVPK